jgi:hypothetical protein
VAGRFSGRADFDPRPFFESDLTSIGADDVFVAKYTSSNDLVWARQVDVVTWAGNVLAEIELAVDDAGNVYTTGSFQGANVDFNPDPDPASTYLLSSLGGLDAFVLKLDTGGNFVWAKQAGGNGGQFGQDIALDEAGNVYVTGLFDGSADFDPGPGGPLANMGGRDSFVWKLTSGGNHVWARQFGGSGAGDSAFARGIAVDCLGHVHTTGNFYGTVDFDPGSGTVNLNINQGPVFVSKLDSAGQFIWARNMASNPGVPGAQGSAIAVDERGNVYTTGHFSGIIGENHDFDPGPGVANLVTRNGLSDVFVSKLDGNGNYDWAFSLGASDGYAQGNGLTLDAAGDVYITGLFDGTTANFDPDPDRSDFILSGVNDVYIWNLDSTGDLGRAFVLDDFSGTHIDTGWDIAVDGLGNIYTTGTFNGTIDFDPGPGDPVWIDTQGGSDMFVSKLLQPSVGDLVWHDQDGDGIQDAGEPGIAGAVVELFRSDDFRIGDADDVSLATQVTDANGRYRFSGLQPDIRYYVTFRPPVSAPPTSFTFAPRDAGVEDAVDSDAVHATGRLASTFALTLGEARTNVDAGLIGAFPSFGWAVGPGSTGTEAGQAIATDAAGNVYVTGQFEGTVDFDPGPAAVNLISLGGNDVFVAKYSPSGALVWARQAGGTNDEVGFGITVDCVGNVYTTGQFRGRADFDPGPGTLNRTSLGDTDIFVWKLDRDGNLVWAHRQGDRGPDAGRAIAVDGQGNVHTTGSFTGEVDFDPGSATFFVTSASTNDAFVWKLHSDGSFVWARPLASRDQAEGFGIALDSQDNVYTTGSFLDTADVGITSNGGRDIFVWKLSRDGLLVWARSAGSTGIDGGTAIAVDQFGNAYTTGRFAGNVDFDPAAGPPANLISNNSTGDAFVWRLNSNGTYGWASRLGSSSFDGDEGRGIAVTTGRVHVTGFFRLTPTFDPAPSQPIALTSAGIRDVFVWKLSTAGANVGAYSLGDNRNDEGRGIAVSGGYLHTTGYFQNTPDFDPGAGTFNLSSSGGSLDGFVWKSLPPNVAPTDIGLAGSSVPEHTDPGATVGGLSTTDPDGDTDFNYILVPGPGSSSNDLFTIAGNVLRTATVFDFEAQSSHSIRVRGTDPGGLYTEKILTITILNVDEAPAISDIADQTTNEDTPLGPIAFTVGDQETAAGSLTVSASSSNPTLVMDSDIAISGSGANRMLRITPRPNHSGTAVITLTVSDGALTASDSFVLTVGNTELCLRIGDSNHDGLFDSSDLVQIFTVGEYEDDIPGNSTWEEGDWNRDGDFDSSDLVAAFQCGSYEEGPIYTRARSLDRIQQLDEGLGDRKKLQAVDQLFQSQNLMELVDSMAY